VYWKKISTVLYIADCRWEAVAVPQLLLMLDGHSRKLRLKIFLARVEFGLSKPNTCKV
jgi:hypothetical protein